MNDLGWVKLHRKLLNSAVFTNEKLLKVWIWCLLKANHDENDVYIGLQKVLVKSGQFIFGRDTAAGQLKMPLSSVRNYIEALKSDNYLDIKTTNKYSLITIRKWEEYQSTRQQIGQQTVHRIKTNEKQMDTNKNDKNEKNVVVDEILSIMGEKAFTKNGKLYVNEKLIHSPVAYLEGIKRNKTTTLQPPLPAVLLKPAKDLTDDQLRDFFKDKVVGRDEGIPEDYVYEALERKIL